MDGGRVLFDSAGKINDNALRRIRKGVGRGGDILFSHKGTVGKLALVPPKCPPFVCSPQTTFWRSLDERRLDRNFLYYYMQSDDFCDQWESRKGETDMADYVSLTSQRELSIRLPDIEVQRAISSVLGAIDGKIDVNRRLSQTLENLASALFKSWFVDFEPAMAKAAGRKPFGMDDAIARLFPDSFEESQLGPIPKSWELKPLDEIADFLNGLAMQKFPFKASDEPLPVIKIAELRAQSTAGADIASSSIPAKYIVEDGDLLFSWSGTLAVNLWFGGRGALNQHLFKVSSKDFPKWFVHRSLLENLEDFQAIAVDKATTMGHIRRHHLHDAIAVVPPSELLRRCTPIFESMEDRYLANAEETRTLRELRDRLVPELLSGALQIS